MTPDSTLGDFFRADIDIPEIPFGEMLWETAQRFPEKEAVIFQGKKISYRELDGLTNSFANALSGLGVNKGDRVALYMTNRPEYIISFYAAARLGGVATPMNPTYKKDEIQHQLNDAEASVLVVQESLYPLVKSVRSKVPSLKEVIIVGRKAEPKTHLFRDLIRASSPKHPPQVALNWTEDLVALPYSSGTTGLPKGVMLSQQNLVANNIQFISSGRMSERDTLLIFLPFYHIYGMMLVGGGIYAGATLVIMEAFDLELSLALAQQHHVTLYYAVPPIMVALDNYKNINQFDLSHMRYIMVGAAPLAPDVGQRVQEKNRGKRAAGIRPYGSLSGDAPEPRRSGLREARFGRPAGAEPGAEDRRSQHRGAGAGQRRRRRAARQRPARHEGLLEVARGDEPRIARRLAGDR